MLDVVGAFDAVIRQCVFEDVELDRGTIALLHRLGFGPEIFAQLLETIRSVLIAQKVSIAMPLLLLRVLCAMVATTAPRRQLTRQLYQQRQATSPKMVSLPKSIASQVHIRT